MKRYFPPISISTLTKSQVATLRREGWRTFALRGRKFMVPPQKPHAPPIIEGIYGKIPRLPRITQATETSGPNIGEKIDLIAWPHSEMTVQDFDDPFDVPNSLGRFNDVFGYVWTQRGLQIYQHGRHKLDPNADDIYERIAKENRGWYGTRVRNKVTYEARTLVTTDEKAAKVWLLAGGKVRLVKDLGRSFGVSRDKRKYSNLDKFR